MRMKPDNDGCYRWDGILKETGDDYHALCDRRGKWDNLNR